MVKEVVINIVEVTVGGGRKKNFHIDIDGNRVTIPVNESLFTNYQEQFYRPNPTPLFRRRFATLMNLMRLAYKQGMKDGAD